jgi:hypothetical protein
MTAAWIKWKQANDKSTINYFVRPNLVSTEPKTDFEWIEHFVAQHGNTKTNPNFSKMKAYLHAAKSKDQFYYLDNFTVPTKTNSLEALFKKFVSKYKRPVPDVPICGSVLLPPNVESFLAEVVHSFYGNSFLLKDDDPEFEKLRKRLFLSNPFKSKDFRESFCQIIKDSKGKKDAIKVLASEFAKKFKHDDMKTFIDNICRLYHLDKSNSNSATVQTLKI